MVVAGRVVGDDVAIMMVEAEATDGTLEPHRGRRHRARPKRSWPRGLRPPSRSSATLCEAQAELAAAGGQGDRRVPDLPRVQR